jgi:hypothetical protein
MSQRQLLNTLDCFNKGIIGRKKGKKNVDVTNPVPIKIDRHSITTIPGSFFIEK